MLKKYIEMKTRLAELQRGKDEGAAMVEYGLLVAGIAVVVAVAVFALGDEIVDLFDGIDFGG